MSGPIVRKYGFPNFEKIYGPREPQHGADDKDKAKKEVEAPAAETPAPADEPKKS